MAPPKLLPLDEWLKWFEVNPLPVVVDALFAGETVAQGVRPCVVSDITKERLFAMPGKGDNVTFSDPKDVSPATTYTNIDDQLYRRFLTGTGGLQYMKELPDKSGNRIPIGPSVIDLCRDTSAEKSGYAVYRTVNTLLENHPDLPQMREVSFNFTPGEIIAIVDGLRLDRTHYGVNETDHTRFMVFPDSQQIDEIISYIKGPYSPILTERREPMIEAIQNIMKYEKKAQKAQEDLSAKMDLQMTILGILSAIPIYLMAKQAGYTSSIDSFISNVFRATIDTPGHLYRKEIKTFRTQWRSIFQSKSPIVVEMTSKLRNLVVPLTDASKRILEGFDRGELPHVIAGGPSGGGKGFSVEAAFAAAIQGKSGVEAFEGVELRASRISAGAIIQKAGSWANRAEQLFSETFEKLNISPHLVQLTEADQLGKAGYGSGNESLNLLIRLYRIMEDYKNVFIVLESTRWQDIEKAAPDILRRTYSSELRPPLPQEVRKALETGIEIRKSGKDVTKVSQKRYERLTFTPEALDAVTALGSFERGAPPSAYLLVMDGVASDVSKKTPKGKANVMEDDVVRYVAKRTGSDVADVQSELDALLKGGVENNPKIQSRVVTSFYRAYASPYNGFFNPVVPNPEKVTITRSNGEEEALPIGAYKSAAEAIRAGESYAPTAPITSRLAAAAGTGLKTPTAPNFTQDDFVDLIKAKFQKIELTVNSGAIKTLADLAFEEWERKGKPMDVINGHNLPNADVIDAVMTRAAAAAKDVILKPALSEAIRKAEERRAEGKSFTDDLPVDIKAKAGGK